MNWDSVRIWVAIILLLDAGIGLWNQERFARVVPGVPVMKIAMLEVAAAFFLLVLPVLARLF